MCKFRLIIENIKIISIICNEFIPFVFLVVAPYPPPAVAVVSIYHMFYFLIYIIKPEAYDEG